MTAELVDRDFKDAKVGGHVGAILFGVSAVVFLVMLGVAIVVAINDRNQSGSLSVAALIAIPGLVVCTVVFGLLARWSLGKLRMWKRLEQRSVAAWGTVGQVRPSATKIQTRRLHLFTLTVTPTDGAPYETEAKWFLPDDLEAAITPGTAVAVRVDPEDAHNVVIDWPQTRAAWTATGRMTGQ